MKKYLILASALLTFVAPSFSQITPSSYAVGGSSSFNFSSRTSGEGLVRTTFNIRPEFGKFVSEKWYIGGALGYGLDNGRNTFLDQKLTSRLQVFSGNFVATRYYPLAEKFYFTLEYGLGLNLIATHNETYNNSVVTATNSQSFGANIGVSPGLAYFITNKWMIFARLGKLSYDFSGTFGADNSGYHSIGYSFQGNSFGLGVRYVFGGK